MLGGTHKSWSQGSGASLTERNHGTEGLKKVNSPGKTSPLSLPHRQLGFKASESLGVTRPWLLPPGPEVLCF